MRQDPRGRGRHHARRRHHRDPRHRLRRRQGILPAASGGARSARGARRSSSGSCARRVDEALKLESALARLRNEHLIALLHYAPIQATVEGEPLRDLSVPRVQPARGADHAFPGHRRLPRPRPPRAARRTHAHERAGLQRVDVADARTLSPIARSGCSSCPPRLSGSDRRRRRAIAEESRSRDDGPCADAVPGRHRTSAAGAGRAAAPAGGAGQRWRLRSCSIEQGFRRVRSTQRWDSTHERRWTRSRRVADPHPNPSIRS